MKQKGVKFTPGKVTEWLDCGNKDATVYTNQRVLEFMKGDAALKGTNVTIENSTIIEPCYLGNNVVISNSVVGPHVSLGDNTKVANSVIADSIVQQNSKITNRVLRGSMIGSFAEITGRASDLSVGDYNVIKD